MVTIGILLKPPKLFMDIMTLLSSVERLSSIRASKITLGNSTFGVNTELVLSSEGDFAPKHLCVMV